MDEPSLIYTFIYNIIVPFIPAIDKSHVLCILCMQTKNPCNSPNFNNAREKTLQKSNLGQDYDWDQFYIIPIKFKHVFMSRLAGQNDASLPASLSRDFLPAVSPNGYPHAIHSVHSVHK